MLVLDDKVIVAGCDPIIRAFNIQDGEKQEFMGHKGWVYCLMYHEGYLYSGGDDNVVRIWDIGSAREMGMLEAHTNGVTSIVICCNMLITSGFDRYIISWDLFDMVQRCEER